MWPFPLCLALKSSLGHWPGFLPNATHTHTHKLPQTKNNLVTENNSKVLSYSSGGQRSEIGPAGFKKEKKSRCRQVCVPFGGTVSLPFLVPFLDMTAFHNLYRSLSL